MLCVVLDMECEINRCIQEMESAFELLVPKPDTLFSQIDTPIKFVSDSVSSEESCDSSGCEYQQLEIRKTEKSTISGRHLDEPVASLGCPDRIDKEASLTCEETNEQLSQENTNISEDLTDINDIDLTDINDQVNISEDDPSVTSRNVDINFLQRHGMTSHHVPLVVSVSVLSGDSGRVVVKESEDTMDIITLLRDNYKLVINRFLPMVRKWLKVKCFYQFELLFYG